MEFQSLRNIENSFKRIRLYTLLFTLLCLLVCGWVVWWAFAFAEAQRQQIYVLDQGKSLMLALSQDVNTNRSVEAQEHVRRFHELFFTLAPTKDAIRSNVDRALHMCDRSAFEYYKDLAEDGYFKRMLSGNVSQKIYVDSIYCDMDSYPYRVRCWGHLHIIRKNSLTERSLVTSCTLINTVRSETNPQGFMMEHFDVVENRDIRTIDR